jgi:hypothetical protein
MRNAHELSYDKRSESDIYCVKLPTRFFFLIEVRTEGQTFHHLLNSNNLASCDSWLYGMFEAPHKTSIDYSSLSDIIVSIGNSVFGS